MEVIEEEKGIESVGRLSLQEYANTLARELFFVKSTIDKASTDEIELRMEETKISMAMYKSVFDFLLGEHTRRINVTNDPVTNNIDITSNDCMM